METIEKLYSELMKDGRVKKEDMMTSAIYTFNHNISRALMLPTLVYGPDSDIDWGYSDTLFLRQTAIVQIVTSLEVYYQDTFEAITRNLKTSEIDAVALSRFLRENRLLTELTETLQNEGTIDFHLSGLIPKYYPFQDKEKIKLALNLVGIDPIGSFDMEWANTFGDNNDSTASLRHLFIHKGCLANLHISLKKDFVRNKIKDAIVLANFVDGQIIKKFNGEKLKELYPTPIEK